MRSAFISPEASGGPQTTKPEPLRVVDLVNSQSNTVNSRGSCDINAGPQTTSPEASLKILCQKLPLTVYENKDFDGGKLIGDENGF